MSLELLKEKFGHSGVIKKSDNREQIQERLNVQFNNSRGDFKDIKIQHQEELEEKDRIIKNLETQTSELATEVLALEKEKATLLDNLNKSKWMEEKVQSTSQKIYEDKLKQMEFVDSTKLIPLLISVSREKQGNTKLNWGEWLKISENKYLFQINESLAKRVFEDTIALIDRAVSYINRRRTYGGDVAAAKNYSLTFTGDTAATGTGDHVRTTFDPIAHELYNGFTLSFWVRPDEIPVATHLFGIGRRNANSKERFTFGLQNATRLYVGVGQQKKTYNDHEMEVGNWYHWVFTFAGGSGGALKAYRNGTDIELNNSGGSGGNATSIWTQTSSDEPIFFGGRNLIGSYNNGWACTLDEVAIFDTVKDATWVSGVYNNSTNYDHTGTSNLVGYWKMNEGSGTTVEDLSVNDNHGTLTAGTGTLPTWEEIESYK